MNGTVRPLVRAVLAFALVGAAVVGHLGVFGVSAEPEGLAAIDALAGAAVTFYFVDNS